jgi:hypothetical protein
MSPLLIVTFSLLLKHLHPNLKSIALRPPYAARHVRKRLEVLKRCNLLIGRKGRKERLTPFQ